MIGINEFSADTYIEKKFQGVRLYHICKAVVECVHTNKSISVEVMNNADMQEHLDAIMCYEKKSYLAYEVKKNRCIHTRCESWQTTVHFHCWLP